MNVVWFILGLILAASGVIGVIRGRIDKKYFTKSQLCIIPLVIGVGLMFIGAAPPFSGRGLLEETPPPPPSFEETLTTIYEIIKRGTPISIDLLPEQQELFGHWEKQLTAAYNHADRTLKQVSKIMESLNQGRIDRFTAWSRLGVLSVDLNQSNLQLHDLIPPSKLDLIDQKRLQSGLDYLNRSLAVKRKAIINLKSFISNPSQSIYLTEYAKNLESAHQLMVQGITEISIVKSRLDL
jgi:hypothetical protein